MDAFEELIDRERAIDTTVEADVNMCKPSMTYLETCEGYFLTFIGKVG